MPKNNHSLLIAEPPLQVLPSLAEKIGLNEAIILQQLHYWLDNPKSGKTIDGTKWIYNTYKEWQENFPFWSERTIRRSFKNLEEIGIVISYQQNSYDREKYYRIDYDKMDTLNRTDWTLPCGQNGRMDVDKMDDSLTESTSENSSESTQKKSPAPLPEEIEISTIQKTLEEIIGLPPANANDITAMDEIEKMGASSEDIKNGVDEYIKTTGKTVRYYSSIVGWVRTAMAKRTQQKISQLKPQQVYIDAYGNEVIR